MSSVEKNLLKIKAVFLSPKAPFTWASGIKSPIYCDNRLVLSYPEVRVEIEHALADLVKEKFPECEILMGTATAGIPHAAYVSEYLGLPMGYVRSGNKDHGRQNKIEGHYEKGDKVVVVEDLISTGGSCIDVVNVLRNAGAEVLGVVAIVTYGMKKATERFAEANVSFVTCSNYDTLIDIAAEEGYIQADQKEKLIAFRNNPSDESWMK